MPNQEKVIEQYIEMINMWRKSSKLEKERWRMTWEKRNENWNVYWHKRGQHAVNIATLRIIIMSFGTMLMKVVKEAGLLYCRKCNLVFTPDNLPLVIKTEASKKRRYYNCPKCSSSLAWRILPS